VVWRGWQSLINISAALRNYPDRCAAQNFLPMHVDKSLIGTPGRVEGGTGFECARASRTFKMAITRAALIVARVSIPNSSFFFSVHPLIPPLNNSLQMSHFLTILNLS